MAGHSVTVGNVELVSVSDGFPIRSPLMPFPDTSLEQWREFPGMVNDNDQVSSRYGSLVVRSGGKLILVDTGLQAADGILLEDMERKGVDREAVDLSRTKSPAIGDAHRRARSARTRGRGSDLPTPRCPRLPACPAPRGG